jgi:hypothetical protein
VKGFQYLLRRNPVHVAEVKIELHCFPYEPVCEYGPTNQDAAVVQQDTMNQVDAAFCHGHTCEYNSRVHSPRSCWNNIGKTDCTKRKNRPSSLPTSPKSVLFPLFIFKLPSYQKKLMGALKDCLFHFSHNSTVLSGEKKIVPWKGYPSPSLQFPLVMKNYHAP